MQIRCYCIIMLSALWTVSLFAQTIAPRTPELIRDTDVADREDNAEPQPPKELNPLLSEKNISIGDFYFKKKNYNAAIQRYLEALQYQPDSIRAHEALARAYEKKGDLSQAMRVYKDFIEQNPDSPKIPAFRLKIAKLEKKSIAQSQHKGKD